MAKRLGDNPLFQQQGSFDAEKEREAWHYRTRRGKAARTAKRMKELIRDNPAQEGLTADWTRATSLYEKDTWRSLRTTPILSA